MKSRILKLIPLLLVSCFLMGSISFANNDTKSSSLNEKMIVLCEKGYPQEILDDYGESLINYLYDKVQKDNIESITATTETYINESPISTRANIPTSTLKVIVNTINYADASGRITGLDIDTSYTWLVNPDVKSTDAITLNWDSSLFKYSGYMNGYNTVVNSSNEQEDYFNFISEATNMNNAGIGWYTELQSPNLNADLQVSPYGQFYISFSAAKEFYAQDDVRTIINYQYNHNTGSKLNLVNNGDKVNVTSDGGNDVLNRRIVYSSKVIN